MCRNKSDRAMTNGTDEQQQSKTEDEVVVFNFNTDAILESLGFGWFQLKFVLFASYGILFPQAAVLIFNFLGADPPHRCFVEGCDSREEPRYFAEWMDDATIQELLQDIKLPKAQRQWSCKVLDLVNTSCAAVDFDSSSLACRDWIFDQSVISSSIVTQFELVYDDSWKITFASFITMLGILVGAFILGPLPDLIGRKKAVVVCTVWMSSFGIGSSFAPDYPSFVAMRFLTAMGGQAAILSFIIWGMEAMPPSYRLGFYCIMGISAAVGNLLSGLFAYLVRDWRDLQLCIFVPLSFMFISLFFLPESARWLASRKRYSEAKEIFLEAAKINKKILPANLLVIPDSNNQTEKDDGNISPFVMLMEMLKTPCLLKRIVILAFAWFAQFLCNFGLSYASANLASDIYLNYVLIMFVDFPANIAAFFAVGRLGRRLIANIALLAGGIACLAAGLVPKEFNEIVVTFSLVGKFFASILVTTNQTMTVEMFPTPARGATLAIIATIGKLGGIVSPYIAALGVENRSLPYITFGGVSLAAGLLTLLLPETKGLNMPSTIQDAKDLEGTRLSPSRILPCKTGNIDILSLQTEKASDL